MQNLPIYQKYIKDECYFAIPQPTSRNPEPTYEVVRFNGVNFHKLGNTRPYPEKAFERIVNKPVMQLVGNLLRDNESMRRQLEDKEAAVVCEVNNV